MTAINLPSNNYWRYATASAATFTTTSATPFITTDVSYSPNDTGISTEIKDKLDKLEALFFRKVVSKCSACGQWGAAMCECKHCGHPIDMGEMPK